MRLTAPIISAIASTVAASVVQQPLLSSPENAPQPHLKKPLVTSEAIQADIRSEKLLERAKRLFEIAKISEDEYGHPTRVINSDGKSECNVAAVVESDSADATLQAISTPSTTSIRLSRAWGITMISLRSTSPPYWPIFSNLVWFWETRSRHRHHP